MPQLGFHVEVDRCIKCWACEVACKQWNNIDAGGISRRVVYEETSGTFPDVTRKFISVACMHCVNAPCVEMCPTGALSKREDDGIVVVNQDECLLCPLCLSACPFDIPQFTDTSVDICDCCIGAGVEPGDTPYCVLACPVQALQFGVIADEDIDVTQLSLLEMVSLELSSVNDVSSVITTDATVIKSPDELSSEASTDTENTVEETVEDDDC